MNSPIRLLIHGASGRMGQALLRLCATREDCIVVAAVARRVAQRVADGVPHFAAHELAGAPAFDVAIDFSLPDGFDGVLALCVERGAAFVSGTTGLSDAQRTALDQAAVRIPLLWAANFSIGVAVLTELVRRTAELVPEWDCDIVESHHTQKRDAPSGTAVVLAAAVDAARGRSPSIASLRAGDIVGEHLVQFTSHGERLELVHRATHRDLFAAGALRAALALKGRSPQPYRLADVLFPSR
jgi:4-hydroxy-tetrahydrodipicolinate reductase